MKTRPTSTLALITTVKKNLIIYLLLFPFAAIGQNRVLEISVVNEFEKPIDGVFATILTFSEKFESDSSKNGIIHITIDDTSKYNIRVQHPNYYTENILFSNIKSKEKADTIKLKKTLKSMLTIRHNYKSLDFENWVTSTDLTNLPDSISFYNNPKLFLFNNTEFLKLNKIDSSNYQVINVDGKERGMDNSNNSFYLIDLNNSSVTIKFKDKEKRYYITGFGRNEYEEITFLKETN